MTGKASHRLRASRIRQVCNDCHADYQNIVYVRLVGIETFDYYDNMLITWSDKDNKLGTDFQLYSSMVCESA